ncbi:MFS general substrate transporter [Boletus edulis]|uniref:Major facilitator superfamily domain-containing protein n=1 Tax=Boletus edulis BED1 TaxID=1328754 RepID=A0AAD4BKC9_BOLED|nr:MFS general substrate transporter [Boletus edulis]KAF8433493.1 major facilitator superfamily domain-containing protein [Boletus edulis BED1]
MLRHLLARAVLLQRNASGNNSDELGGEEFKLPRTASLVIVIAYNMMLQLSFFVVISSSGKYVEHLGGNATFSGIAIGIPTLISGIALFPMTRYDKGRYATALHIGCFTGLLGQVAYAIAYRANFLYLILVGRCLSGISFSGFMYCKRYCTDPSIVGIRRRTTLSSWLVIGQAVGMTLGPFLGGVLYKVGFQSAIFNGYTSPGWFMASCHGIFWLIVARYFEDVHTSEMNTELYEIPIPASSIEEGNRIRDSTLLPPSVTSRPPSQPEESFAAQLSHITRPQWGVIVCMCWFSMVCFFVLGSWEANLPIFGAATPTLNWSPFTAGNFIALTGITAFPFFLANMLFAHRIQDRQLLALGSGLGLCGLLVFILLQAASKVVYGSLFACWWLIALGFNVATTVTLSLLSKQLPPEWTRRASMAIQYSIYTGRLTGAIWGGSGVAVGMVNFVGLEIGLVGFGGVLFTTLWKNLKAKTG